MVFAHNLLDISRPNEFSKDFDQLVNKLVYKTLGVKTPNHKLLINSDLPHGRFMLLGLCGFQAEIVTELSDNLETLALNDKESYGIAFKSLLYFSTFLGNSNNA